MKTEFTPWPGLRCVLLCTMVVAVSVCVTLAYPPTAYYYGTLTGVVARGESILLPNPPRYVESFSPFQDPFPATFQWKFQGTNIAGATNPLAFSRYAYYAALNVANAQPSDAGAYTLVASNADGVLTLTNQLQVEPLVISGPYAQISNLRQSRRYEGG